MNIYDSPINLHTRVGRMLDALASSDNRRARVVVTVTVRNAEGGRRYHEAFAIRQWTAADGDRILSVSVHKSGDYHAGEAPITCLHLNLRTREVHAGSDPRGQAPLIRYAAKAALRYAWTGVLPTPANGSVEAAEAARCGRCGRMLYDWASIQLGVGPECRGGRTGSRTIRSIATQELPDLAPTT